MAELYTFGEFITQGEQKTAFHLKDSLPKDWTIVSNKILVMPNRSTREVDLIVIGDHRIFVIDEKGFGGKIHGNDTYWALESRESLASPLNNMEMIARKVAGYLRDQVSGLSSDISGHFVVPMVVLSNDSAEIFIQEPRRDQIVTLKDADQVLKAMDRRGREVSISPFRNQIMERLRVLPPRPSLPRKINAYRIIEALAGGPYYRTFLAEHDTGGRRRLKVYELETTPENEQSRQKELIYRDFHALSQATAEGIAPLVDMPFMWGDDRYIVVPQHLVSAPSLRVVASELFDRPTPFNEALLLSASVLSSLDKLHNLGILHRNLTPDTVYVDRRNDPSKEPHVIFSDFDFARIPDQGTIADPVDALGLDNPYRAPELEIGIGFASQASDIYSVGLMLAELLSGETAEEIRKRNADCLIPRLAAVETDLLADETQNLRTMLELMVTKDDLNRWQSAKDACKLVTALMAAHETRHSSQPATSTLSNLTPPITKQVGGDQNAVDKTRNGNDGVFQKGDLIDEQYEVVRVLGAGATAITYLVRDIHYSGDQWVLKTIKNPIYAKLFAGNEYQALKKLNHKAIPRVFDVRRPDAPFHIRREYVDGVPLAELQSEFPWPIDRVLSFSYDILDALTELERNGLAHRDISDRNILISNDGPKLIDFGLAISAVDAHQTLVGTPAFRAPELDRLQGWNSTCDTYSLGVIMFQMATGVFPFPHDISGRYDKSQLIPIPTESLVDPGAALIFGEVLKAISRSIAQDQYQRYISASDFSAALQNAAAAEVQQQPSKGIFVVNSWVSDLQGLYKNSRVGNADNRGLDTVFASETYVPTRLDQELIPRVLSGKYAVVLLSGNPGDGKTAWLEKLGDELEERNATPLDCDRHNGWRYKIDGHIYAANYDASESSKEKRANELLNEILAPLRGDYPPRPTIGYTALIAINDGRLRDFLLSNDSYNWLGKQVYRLLDQPNWSVDRRIALVDLKQRSVVGGDIGEQKQIDLYESVLLRLLDTNRWSPCEECRARYRCPMKFNRDTLADLATGSLIRGRMRALFQMTHLRGERHITMRDLRSALAYIVAGKSSCEDIHKEADSGLLPPDWYNRLYFMASFNPTSEDDENLKEFAVYDPAQVTSPRLDRFLHFRRRASGAEELNGVMVAPTVRSDYPLKALTIGALGRYWYDAYKRRLFFESNPQRLFEKEQLLPSWTEMLPYRYFTTFLDTVTGKLALDDIGGRLCEGISRASGVADPRLYQRFLCIRTTQTGSSDLTVFKRFPQSAFVCEIANPRGEHVEVLPHALQLTHIMSGVSITIGLDLFEILLRFTEGYEPGAEEQQPFVIDLAQFQNQLLNQTATELLLLESGRQLHRVRQDGGEIVLFANDEVLGDLSVPNDIKADDRYNFATIPNESLICDQETTPDGN